MDKIVLYSTNCPRCNVLKKKLSEKSINFTEVTDKELMIKMGMTDVPILSVNNNLMDFGKAVKWINSIGE